MKKHSLKLYVLLFTIFCVFCTAYLMINNEGIPPLDEPFSAIGNAKGNLAIFIIGVSILGIFFSFIMHGVYKRIGLKYGKELYVIPILVVITLIIPYHKEDPLNRILHMISGVICALFAIWMMWKVNRHNKEKNIAYHKSVDIIPVLAFSGTLLLFLIFGLTVIMEIFYLLCLLLWMTITSFSLSHSKF